MMVIDLSLLCPAIPKYMSIHHSHPRSLIYASRCFALSLFQAQVEFHDDNKYSSAVRSSFYDLSKLLQFALTRFSHSLSFSVELFALTLISDLSLILMLALWYPELQEQNAPLPNPAQNYCMYTANRSAIFLLYLSTFFYQVCFPVHLMRT
jgi:hypothetical protein